MSELARIGVAIETDLLAQFDRLIESRGYASRSEAFRDLIRAELNAEQTQHHHADSHVVGTLTLLYDHHVRMLSEKLTEMQHEHHEAIVSTLHVHLDHHNCLEVIVLKGRNADVQSIASKLIAAKGVKQGRLTLSASHAH
jgi:CopG family nickel-responsive transcriptional regulator